MPHKNNTELNNSPSNEELNNSSNHQSTNSTNKKGDEEMENGNLSKATNSDSLEDSQNLSNKKKDEELSVEEIFQRIEANSQEDSIQEVAAEYGEKRKQVIQLTDLNKERKTEIEKLQDKIKNVRYYEKKDLNKSLSAFEKQPLQLRITDLKRLIRQDREKIHQLKKRIDHLFKLLNKRSKRNLISEQAKSEHYMKKNGHLVKARLLKVLNSAGQSEYIEDIKHINSQINEETFENILESDFSSQFLDWISVEFPEEYIIITGKVEFKRHYLTVIAHTLKKMEENEFKEIEELVIPDSENDDNSDESDK